MQIGRMSVKDLSRVEKILPEIFAIKRDIVASRNTLRFHFIAAQRGIDDGRRFWIGMLGRQIVGFVGIVKGIKGICWLSWFGVRKKFRGHGFGNALFEHALKQAKRLGARTMCIETGISPAYGAANALYKSFGFKETGITIKNFWNKGDDLVILKKIL